MFWQTLDLSGLLAAIGKTFEVEFEPLQVDSASFEVLDIKNMPSHLDRLLASRTLNAPLRDLPLWAKLWPGSLVLGRFLRNFEPEGKSLLELGCGMAGLSLVASQYGFSRIVASDIAPEALAFARANILRNGLEEKVCVQRLDVCSPGKQARYDMIAAAELLYLDELHRPLLKFVSEYLAPGGKAFFCTDLARLKPRFQKLAARKFALQEGKIAVRGDSPRVYSILILENKHE